MNQSSHQVSSSLESTFEEAILYHLRYSLGLKLEQSSKRELCLAISLAVRNILIERMFEAEEQYQKSEAKRLKACSRATARASRARSPARGDPPR
jgi:hypothetical protein